MNVKCFWIERDGDGWRRRDTGEHAADMDAFGVGALFVEPDGNPEAVHVRTVGGWVNLATWQRVGDPRQPATFSVHPSIFVHGDTPWHGWLRVGELVPA